jgi:hypothetical protein
MNDVRLHRVEERLHVGVVCDLLPWPVHALHEAERGQPGAEGIRGVLDAPVGMEDEPRPGTPIARLVEVADGRP